MTYKICACCGQPFKPRPQVPNQTYCSSPACQSERRKSWQRNKIRTDPDYRENQSKSQRAWLDRNPDYWRKYRGKDGTTNPNPPPPHPCVPFPSGIYRIRFATDVGVAKSDAWIVEISPVCADCPCKKDVCKDRT